jgi:hypothetical protein
VIDGSQNITLNGILGNTIRWIVPDTSMKIYSEANALCSHLKCFGDWATDIPHFFINPSNIYLYLPFEKGSSSDRVKKYLAENPYEIIGVLREPVFEPFPDQTPFYNLTCFDEVTHLSFVGESDNVEPVATIRFPRHEDGALVTTVHCDRKKTKMVSEISTETFILESVTINADSSITFDFMYELSDGYECKGVVGYDSGNSNVVITKLTPYSMTLRNLNSASPLVVKPSITILKVKTS